MPSSLSSPLQLFQGDIVSLLSSPTSIAMVVRAWTDEEAPPPPPPGEEPHPLDRALKRGEVGISLLFRASPDTPSLQILNESTLQLVDRLLQPGDIVKRSHDSPRSGVVMSVDVECRLEHVVSGQRLEGWAKSGDLEGALKVEVGDRVISEDWIGVIEEIFEEGTVETPTGETWKVADMGAMLDTGRRVNELFPPGTTVPPLRSASLWSSSGAAGPPPPRDISKEVVVFVQATVICVNWIAISQMVPINLQDQRPRPKRFWTGVEMKDLLHVTSPLDHLPQVGTKVCFRSAEVGRQHGLVPTVHAHGKISVGAMVVRETRTSVVVLWQDGNVKTERTTDLLPHINIDEYDCWPGDHVVFKGDEKSPEAIVQKVNAEERTAEIQIVGEEEDPSSTRETTLVSVLELDPHGSPPDTFGVSRGDLVLIGLSSNGCLPPRVPRIGEYDTTTTVGEIRDTLTRLGLRLSSTSQSHSQSLLASAASYIRTGLGLGSSSATSSDTNANANSTTDAPPQPSNDNDSSTKASLPTNPDANPSWKWAVGGVAIGTEQDWSMSKDLDAIDWYGEVKDLRLDGKVEVTLPGGRVAIVELERLSILNEGGERGMFGDENGGDDGEEGSLVEEGDGEWEEMDGLEDEEGGGGGDLMFDSEEGEEEAGVLREVDEWGREDDDDEEEDEEESAVARSLEDLQQQQPAAPSSSSTTSIVAPIPVSASSTSAANNLPSTLLPTATPPIPSILHQQQAHASSSSAPKSKLADSPEWTRFEMLEEVPEDHHFFNIPVGKPNAAFSTRMQKEFKVLASSLPETILVRTYEDRMDLLRCLIIGPAGTPYVDSPLLIDFHCDASKFPFSPPTAHFHSWTRGMGRCNPNLYEDGKVCLSILGTWAAGDASEGWNPLKSSLLQTFVSIQGLVLVREPWFCEPAFEKLRGTKEATVNSRQYSEKAFVLTRGFVLHALQYPIASFADEITHYYITLGKLEEVIDGVKKLIEISGAGGVREEEAWGDGDGVGRLTMGAILPLKRTIEALEKIWEERKAS